MVTKEQAYIEGPHHKEYNGETYLFNSRYSSLAEARKQAKRLRKIGYKAQLFATDACRWHELWITIRNERG